MMIHLNLLQHGSLEYGQESFEDITDDAGLAEVMTYELASMSALGLWRFIADQIETAKDVEKVRRLGQIRGVITERSPHITQMNIGQIYDLTGYHDSAMIHYDSSRILLEDIIDRGEYQYHALSELGLTFAVMGRKEEAISAGKAAVEYMTVEECHW
jgi:tetratricopeptide (TPR) repeat protein